MPKKPDYAAPLADPTPLERALRLDDFRYANVYEGETTRALSGRLTEDGYLLPGQSAAPGPELDRAKEAAATLAARLNAGGLPELMLHTTPYVPFVVPAREDAPHGLGYPWDWLGALDAPRRWAAQGSGAGNTVRPYYRDRLLAPDDTLMAFEPLKTVALHDLASGPDTDPALRLPSVPDAARAAAQDAAAYVATFEEALHASKTASGIDHRLEFELVRVGPYWAGAVAQGLPDDWDAIRGGDVARDAAARVAAVAAARAAEPPRPAPTLAERLQLGRFAHITDAGWFPALAATITEQGTWKQEGETLKRSEGRALAVEAARAIVAPLWAADLVETSDTDAAYVPFVLPHRLSPEAFDATVAEWIGLAPVPEGATPVEIAVAPSGFRLSEKVAEHDAEDGADLYYEPDELAAIEAAAEAFGAALTDVRTVELTASYVATLVLNVGRTPRGYWAGLATLRIDT